MEKTDKKPFLIQVVSYDFNPLFVGLIFRAIDEYTFDNVEEGYKTDFYLLEKIELKKGTMPDFIKKSHCIVLPEEYMDDELERLYLESSAQRLNFINEN